VLITRCHHFGPWWLKRTIVSTNRSHTISKALAYVELKTKVTDIHCYTRCVTI